MRNGWSGWSRWYHGQEAVSLYEPSGPGGRCGGGGVGEVSVDVAQATESISGVTITFLHRSNTFAPGSLRPGYVPLTRCTPFTHEGVGVPVPPGQKPDPPPEPLTDRCRDPRVAPHGGPVPHVHLWAVGMERLTPQVCDCVWMCGCLGGGTKRCSGVKRGY